jgi:hypothetical protein
VDSSGSYWVDLVDVMRHFRFYRERGCTGLDARGGYSAAACA